MWSNFGRLQWTVNTYQVIVEYLKDLRKDQKIVFKSLGVEVLDLLEGIFFDSYAKPITHQVGSRNRA